MASWVQTNLSPLEKAAAYNQYVGSGLSDKEVREMATKNFGQQTNTDWSELQRLAGTLPKDLLPTDKSFYESDVKAAVLKTQMPTDWSTYDPKKKIDWFNTHNATPAMLKSQGVTDQQIQDMRTGGYKFAEGGEARAYAGGRPLTMEDGGFVFTEEATRNLGPQGIAALGGKMISAPGNGTDDRGITGIIGRKGVTPARVSNGESYFPPGHDTKKLYALMNSLERKA
jgi:hypothetical protein